jgi:phosphatidylserine/phosphatidylglycerophosphate/cardiolipin synthase-like enzyme
MCIEEVAVLKEEYSLLHNMAQRIILQDSQMAERARASLPRGEATPAIDAAFDDVLTFETIVVREGRPVILVENDSYYLTGPGLEVWAERLEQSATRHALERVIPAVGRIEVKNHYLPWLGTGWLVDDDIVVTNRHVAEEFGARGSDGWVFRRGWLDPQTRMQAAIDFREEHGGSQTNEFPVLDILYMEDDDGPDIAFLKVARSSHQGAPLAGKLQLAAHGVTRGQFVATIGYPAADRRIPDQDLVRRIFGDVYNVKRLAPGQVIEERDELVLHDCSTLGGNSGSPIVDLETGAAVGLHFAGLFLRENRGVPAALVADRLEKARTGAIFSSAGIPTQEQAITATAQLVASGKSGDSHTIRLEMTTPIQITLTLGPMRLGGVDNQLGAGGSRSDIDAAVARARVLYGSRPGVLAIRDGYVFRNGWITDEQAVVVAASDGPGLTPRDIGLAESIAGFPLCLRAPALMDIGERLGYLEALEGVPAITYTPPEDIALKLVEEEMKVTCHLSPDAGWPVLREFLAATQQRLTIGMYDFTAPHIVAAVLSAVRQPDQRLALVLQQNASLGGGTKKFDIPEEQTMRNYQRELADRFDFAWASVGENRRFASAYHIKVAVRDGKAIWLSSGNWQSSNQPPGESPASQTSWHLLLNYNREWHVVIENENLAHQFEGFLQHDLRQAQLDAGDGVREMPMSELYVSEAAEQAQSLAGAPTYFPPLTVERRLRVQPLLTPDNYQQHVLDLVRSAEEQILFQNQSLSILHEDKNDPRYAALLDALLAKQQSGVDVRIIVRGEFYSEAHLERLKKRGFDMNRVRLQDRCHTKGIIVDGQAVLIGSHNWTNQGALVNRDASLIIFDGEIAGYFARAFWFDWKNLARQRVAPARRVQLGDSRETPPGMVRMMWSELV